MTNVNGQQAYPVSVVGGSTIKVSEYGNYIRVQLNQFDSVVVCDVNIRQAQSAYLAIDGIIFYAEMQLIGKSDHCSHDGTIESMEEFISKYPEEYYNLYSLEYMKCNFIRGFNKEIKRMEELQKIYNRDYKLNEIL
jgi:hypothetical protein